MLRVLQTAAVILSVLCAPHVARAEDSVLEWFQERPADPGFHDPSATYRGFEIFRIGDMVFAYDKSCFSKDDKSNLDQLETIEKRVELAAPDRATTALVDQLLGSPHAFHGGFGNVSLKARNVSLKACGDVGLLSRVEWTLFPKSGGFSGVPYRYIVLILPGGKVITPRRALYDEFFLEPDTWCFSMLRLETSAKSLDYPDEAEILKRAKSALEKAKGTAVPGPDGSESAHLSFVRQRRVLFPLAVDEQGDIRCRDVWAVEFADHSYDYNEPDEQDVFTVWVSATGQVANLKFLPIPSDDE